MVAAITFPCSDDILRAGSSIQSFSRYPKGKVLRNRCETMPIFVGSYASPQERRNLALQERGSREHVRREGGEVGEPQAGNAIRGIAVDLPFTYY